MYPPILAGGSRSCVASHLPERTLHRGWRGGCAVHDFRASGHRGDRAPRRRAPAGRRCGYRGLMLMAAEPTSAAESRFVDAIARRVIELLDASRGAGATASAAEGEACLTVSQVASRYRVSRSWVYAHQRELGAMRLGEGPRARLRFDAKVVADAVAAFDRRDAPPERSKEHREGPARDEADPVRET